MLQNQQCIIRYTTHQNLGNCTRIVWNRHKVVNPLVKLQKNAWVPTAGFHVNYGPSIDQVTFFYRLHGIK